MAPDAAIDDIIADYIRREETGQPLDPDELMARHPAIASQMREFLGNRQRFQRIIPLLCAEPPRRQFVPPPVGCFGDYELLEEIARGGMGVVYKARQSGLNRIVALKMILAGHMATADDVRRFRAEAESAANLQHPHIVSVHEVGEHLGHHYFSMDYVDGHSLAELIRENPLPPGRAAGYVRSAAQAIDYAHQQGTLHRDLKPSNILIDRNDLVRITDFGLAMRVEGGSELTRTGSVLGSPCYMPPEQAQAQRELIGPGSDVYALGAILYELLTGRPPFRADSAMETIQQVISTECASPRLLNPKVPRDLETICLKCLEKEPHKRYGTAELLAQDLQHYLHAEPILARPVGRAARAWRWCRRNRPVAALLIVSVVLICSIAVTATLAYLREMGFRSAEARQRKVVEAALADEATARKEADRQRQKAQHSAAEMRAAHSKTEAVLASLNAAHHDLRDHADALAKQQRASFRSLLKLVVAEATGNNVLDADENLERFPDELRGWDWKYAKRLCHPEIALFEGARHVGFNPSGTHFATLDDDQVKLRQAPTGETIAKFSATAFAFSGDGTWIALAVPSGTIEVRKIETGAVGIILRDAPEIREIAFSPDGKQSTACFGSTVRTWNISTGEIVHTFASSHSITCIAYDGAGQRLIAGTSEPGVVVWDIATGREELLLSQRLTAALIKLPFGLEGQVRADVADIACIKEDLLAVAQADTVKLFNLSAVTEPRTFAGHIGSVMSVAFSPTHYHLATAGSDGTIRIWDAATGQSIRTLPWHQEAVSSVVFSPDGQWLISGGEQQCILWDISPEWRSRSLSVHSDSVYSLSFSANGRLLASGGGRYGTPGIAEQVSEVRVIQPDSGQVLFSADIPSQQTRRFGVLAVALNPEGTMVAAAGCGNWVKVWDVPSGELRGTVEQVGPEVRSLQFSSNGKQLLVSGSRHAAIWDVAAGAVLTPLPALGSGASAIFSPDGQTVFGCSGRRLVSVDAGTGKTLFSIAEAPAAWRIAVSPDGKLLAISLDKRRFPADQKNEFAHIRDANTGSLIRVLKSDMRRDYADNDFVRNTYGVSFSPDSRQLVTAGGDKTMRVWDVATGDELLVFPHANQVFCALFSPDGRWLVSGSGHWSGPRPGEVRLWEALAPKKAEINAGHRRE